MTDRTAARADRLYELLPVVYRQRDVDAGYPFRELLRVIAEQVSALEDDLFQMYDDWFIETCQDWVVPYIADLVGYRAVQSGAMAGADPIARLRARALVPRREVANYLHDLRRRGTLASLENLAADAAGFPARAVEFFTLLGRMQALNHPDARGRFIDLRDGESLDLIDSPFDRAAHTIDLRRGTAARLPGRHNVPTAGAYVWRLRSYPVTDAPAVFVQQRSGRYAFYTFSILGNDAPLFTRAQREAEPTSIAGEINVPAAIRRRALELHRDEYYGASRSFAIWLNGEEEPVPAARLVAADLTGWKYRPHDGQVVVDPQLGRIMLTEEAKAIRVSYRYGFPGDVGAHQSPRTLMQPRDATLYRVGRDEEYPRVGAALAQWSKDLHGPHPPLDAVVEIADNDLYTEQFEDVLVPATHSLQIRAANRCRPAVRVLDTDVSRGERLNVVMEERARFTLDGILLMGRPLRIEGSGKSPVEVRVNIRRSTLVPGWDLLHDCEPNAPTEPSVELHNVRGTVTVDRSILGSISVAGEWAKTEPVSITLRDSILDATAPDLEAVSGPNGGYAWATLTIVRSTVVGRTLAHAMTLGENAIFHGTVRIVRRQHGCVRFCSVPPGSRTPRRYHSQPDLAVSRVPPERADAERRRVAPRFTSTRFGNPGYMQLARDCPVEIARGADDESEMGAYHHLFLPQRAANLRARLDGSTPAGMETAIIQAD